MLTPAATIAFTEGPAAAADGTVYFSDIINNWIMAFDPGARLPRVWRHPSGRANGLLFDPQGRLLICEGNEFGPNDGNRRLTRFDFQTQQTEVLCDRFEAKRLNSPNDVACTSDGHIYFTDPCYGDRSTMELTHDSVFHIPPGGPAAICVSQPAIQRPNGVALSPDERTLYVIDSCPIVGGNRKLWAFHRDGHGAVSGQRLVYDFAPGRGGDGMAVDSQGLLYVAAGITRPRGPHETADNPPGIYLITPDGKLTGRLDVSEDVITNVTFGGDDLRTLYVTAGKTLWTTRINTPGFVVHR
jgi:gluconolactonase